MYQATFGSHQKFQSWVLDPTSAFNVVVPTHLTRNKPLGNDFRVNWCRTQILQTMHDIVERTRSNQGPAYGSIICFTKIRLQIISGNAKICGHITPQLCTCYVSRQETSHDSKCGTFNPSVPVERHNVAVSGSRRVQRYGGRHSINNVYQVKKCFLRYGYQLNRKTGRKLGSGTSDQWCDLTHCILNGSLRSNKYKYSCFALQIFYFRCPVYNGRNKNG